MDTVPRHWAACVGVFLACGAVGSQLQAQEVGNRVFPSNLVVITGYGTVGYGVETQGENENAFNSSISPIFLIQFQDQILFEVEFEFELQEGITEIGFEYAQLDYIANDYLTLVGGKFLLPFGHPEGEGYAAHVMFYEPGEYHLNFHGTPHGHRMSVQMGERETDVFRRHLIIGPYWVEIESSPAPVLPGTEAHIHLVIFDLIQDGTPGAAVGGLAFEVEVHAPDGSESTLDVEEETPGAYEVQYQFDEAGTYELHVEIGEDRGEFHLPVIDPVGGEGQEGGEGDEHGHGP